MTDNTRGLTTRTNARRGFCACNFDADAVQWSAQWHREHKTHHLTTFPGIVSDYRTVRNLDDAIHFAVEREAATLAGAR